MEAFVLTVRLFAGGPIVEMRVSDCEAGVVWIHEAWRWAKRSGIPIANGPFYACGPAPDRYTRIHR